LRSGKRRVGSQVGLASFGGAARQLGRRRCGLHVGVLRGLAIWDFRMKLQGKEGDGSTERMATDHITGSDEVFLGAYTAAAGNPKEIARGLAGSLQALNAYESGLWVCAI
jgi:hypothetical protein